jgi:pyruvate dehydrogenase complex dehydrogenase (E1) component
MKAANPPAEAGPIVLVGELPLRLIGLQRDHLRSTDPAPAAAIRTGATDGEAAAIAAIVAIAVALIIAAAASGPAIAATDYMRNYADQVREQVQAAGRRYTVLGTDGFGRSDYRKKLRRFFEVDRWHVVVAALKALADDGAIKPSVVAEAIAKYGLDAERAAPWTV